MRYEDRERSENSCQSCAAIARADFDRAFKTAREAREELADKMSPAMIRELEKVCELYFSAGQKNNF
jgi:hypothetical protein